MFPVLDTVQAKIFCQCLEPETQSQKVDAESQVGEGRAAMR